MSDEAVVAYLLSDQKRRKNAGGGYDDFVHSFICDNASTIKQCLLLSCRGSIVRSVYLDQIYLDCCHSACVDTYFDERLDGIEKQLTGLNVKMQEISATIANIRHDVDDIKGVVKELEEVFSFKVMIWILKKLRR